MKQLAVWVVLAFLGLVVPAHADPVSYDISGTQTVGNFSGTILYDPSTGLVSGGTIYGYPSTTATGPASFLFSSETNGTATFSSTPGIAIAVFDLILGGTNAAPLISTNSSGYVYFFLSPFPVASDAVTSGTITPSALPTVTPEPSSLVLLGTGMLAAAGVVRRRLLSA